jgi:hypothetical protein
LTRGLITIALGSPTYIRMAKDLALSARLHAPHLRRAVVSDSEDRELRELFHDVIPARPELGDPLFQKLWLELYAPYDETLFIDSDSLIAGSLDHIWTACHATDVGYVGERKTSGTWYRADIAEVCRACKISWLATLNSGLLFIRRGPAAAAIFASARAAMDRYEELGFEPFRQTRTDEVGFALAFSQHGIAPIADPDGRTMRTPIGIDGPMRVDVLRGYCRFVKHGQPVSPSVVHFATWQYHPVYYRERAKLRLYFSNRLARLLARPGATYVYWRERWLQSRSGRPAVA